MRICDICSKECKEGEEVLVWSNKIYTHRMCQINLEKRMCEVVGDLKQWGIKPLVKEGKL